MIATEHGDFNGSVDDESEFVAGSSGPLTEAVKFRIL